MRRVDFQALDALVLCYPVISTWEYAHEESAENVSAGVVAPY